MSCLWFGINPMLSVGVIRESSQNRLSPREAARAHVHGRHQNGASDCLTPLRESASYHLHYAMPPTSPPSTPPPPAVSWPHVCSLGFVFKLGLDEEHTSLDVSIIDVCYCAPPHSLLIPTRPLARSPLRTSDLKTGGSFPRPRVLTPTLSTAGLASRTETPLQSAPSESYLVRAFTLRQIGRPSCFWAVAWGLGPTSP